MAEGAAAAPDANPDEETYTPSPSKRKVYKYSDTPIIYKDVDVSILILRLVDLFDDVNC